MENYNNVTYLSHPLITHKISRLRDKNTGTYEFRKLVEEIAMLEGFEALKDLPLEDVEVEFIRDFLKNEGNFSKMQEESGKTYASIKATLKEINIKLGITEDKKENIDMKFLATEGQTQVIKVKGENFFAGIASSGPLW